MHCSCEQQDKIAYHLSSIFLKDKIELRPEDETAFMSLKSPEELKYKVLVKGKRASAEDDDGMDLLEEELSIDYSTIEGVLRNPRGRTELH
ncbi:MAG: hypothetical protein SGPRY_014672, partial [Prymnesium sp.]